MTSATSTLTTLFQQIRAEVQRNEKWEDAILEAKRFINEMRENKEKRVLFIHLETSLSGPFFYLGYTYVQDVSETLKDLLCTLDSSTMSVGEEYESKFFKDVRKWYRFQTSDAYKSDETDLIHLETLAPRVDLEKLKLNLDPEEIEDSIMTYGIFQGILEYVYSLSNE